MNIRVDVGYTIKDGTEILFRSPVDCSAITGLIVYYPDMNGNETAKEFALADAHGNNVGDIDHLFAENVVVKVILDVTSGMAFVQNADTNAYLEGRFNELDNVFVGIANETAYGQFYEAKAKGKACFLNYENKLYIMSGYGTGPASGRQFVFYAHNPITGELEEASLNRSGGVTLSTIEVGSGGGGESNVFLGTSETTYAEFSEAQNAGKVCFLETNSGYMPMVGLDNSGARFSVYDPQINRLACKVLGADNAWSTTLIPVIKTVNGKTPNSAGDVTIDAGSGGSGADGFSPIANVTQTSDGAVISITDKDGTTTATITNGKDGADGKDGYTPVKGVDYFDGKDGSAGSPGADGVSPTVAVSKSGKVTTVSITDKNGTKTATINDGADGSAGKDGTSVTVKSVSESTADGGSNVVTFSDGKTVTIKNGSKGSTGATGATGPKPVKGTDYFTEADKAEMVEDVLEALNKDNEIEIFTTEGGYYTTEGVWQSEPSATIKHTDLIPVSAGDKFTYTGVGVFGAASVLWYNSEQQVISYEQHGEWNVLPSAVVVTAPASAAYVRFCGMNCDKFDAILEVSYYEEEATAPTSVLAGKKIVYDGDSICYGAGYKGGYAKLIANKVNGTYENQAVGGARLITLLDGYSYHSIVDNLPNLPKDGDLYCFDGGVNDYWTEGVQLGSFDYTNFTGTLDKTTVCGALETIFRYCLDNFVGKPICFVIVHKVQQTAYKANSTGKTFKDYRDAMIGICEKYSIPYYDAFSRSGLNGWNTVHNQVFFTDGDGAHPNEEAYKRYYVPQMISLFESMMPTDVTEPDVPTEPTYTNVLETAGYTKGIYISGGAEKPDESAYSTGYIECPTDSTVYLKNVQMPNDSSHGNRIGLYKADKSVITGYSITSAQSGLNPVFDSDGNLVRFNIGATDLAFIRLSAWKIDETSIITINEPIV